MAAEITCPYCEASIPLDLSTSSGDEVYCAYCQCPVIAQRLDRDVWQGVQTEEWEVLKRRQRKAEEKAKEKDY